MLIIGQELYDKLYSNNCIIKHRLTEMIEYTKKIDITISHMIIQAYSFLEALQCSLTPHTYGFHFIIIPS